VEAADLFEGLHGLLSGSREKKDIAEKFAAEGEGSWEALLENHFPAASCGRSRLILYDFGRVSPRRIFLHAFGKDDALLQAEPVEKAESEVVIGLLTQLSTP
jgi:hypothetical protein